MEAGGAGREAGFSVDMQTAIPLSCSSDNLGIGIQYPRCFLILHSIHLSSQSRGTIVCWCGIVREHRTNPRSLHSRTTSSCHSKHFLRVCSVVRTAAVVGASSPMQ